MIVLMHELCVCLVPHGSEEDVNSHKNGNIGNFEYNISAGT